MTCSICQSSNSLTSHYQKIEDYEYASVNLEFEFQICPNCGVWKLVPEPSLEQILKSYPSDYRNHLIAKTQTSFFAFIKQIQFQQKALSFQKIIGNHSKSILELGSGNGDLLLALKKLGYHNLTAMDLSNAAAERLESNQINFLRGNIEQELNFSQSFDIIILNNVIEHFSQPDLVLRQLANLLNSNGRVIILTPNTNSWDAKLFKKFWAGLHTPRHLYLFNPSNFRKLASRLGYNIRSTKYNSDPGQWAISVQNLISHLLKRRPPHGLDFYTTILALFSLPLSYLQIFFASGEGFTVVLEKPNQT